MKIKPLYTTMAVTRLIPAAIPATLPQLTIPLSRASLQQRYIQFQPLSKFLISTHRNSCSMNPIKIHAYFDVQHQLFLEEFCLFR